jgi:O-antigen/teichoic acid export membrane protein
MLATLRNKYLLVMMGNALTVVLGFATSFLLFHYLSVQQVGAWFLVMSVVALLDAARSGFLSTATISFYAGTDEKRGAIVLGSVWFLALCMAGIILSVNAIAFLSLPFIESEAIRLCIKWVGITHVSTMVIELVGWRLQAEEKYSKIFSYRLINSVVTISSFGGLVYMGKMTLGNALLYNFLANCLVSGLGLLRSSGVKYILRRTKECTREIVQYGKYMLGTTSCSALLVHADTWVIYAVLGPAAVAVYNLATKFMMVIELPIRSLLITGMSEMAISYNKGDREHIIDIFKRYTGMLTIAFIPVIMVTMILADLPISILGGAQYSHSIATNSFRFFLLVSLLYPMDRFNGLVLDAIRQTKVNLYKVIMMLTIKVVANFVCLSMLGSIYGVNLSYLIVSLSAVVFGNYQLRKFFSYSISDIFETGHRELRSLIQRKLGVYRVRKIDL